MIQITSTSTIAAIKPTQKPASNMPSSNWHPDINKMIGRKTISAFDFNTSMLFVLKSFFPVGLQCGFDPVVKPAILKSKPYSGPAPDYRNNYGNNGNNQEQMDQGAHRIDKGPQKPSDKHNYGYYVK
jgi:hypothetical protein